MIKLHRDNIMTMVPTRQKEHEKWCTHAILFDSDCSVSTDTRQMVISNYPEGQRLDEPVMVHGESCKKLVRKALEQKDGHVELEVMDTYVRLRCGDEEISLDKVEGEPFPWRKAVPGKRAETCITLDVKRVGAIITALRAAKRNKEKNLNMMVAGKGDPIFFTITDGGDATQTAVYERGVIAPIVW